MGRPSTWTEAQVEFLRAQAGRMTSRAIGEALGKTAANVRRQAVELGISLFPLAWCRHEKNENRSYRAHKHAESQRVERMISLSFGLRYEAVRDAR